LDLRLKFVSLFSSSRFLEERRAAGMGSIAKLAKRALETEAPVMVKVIQPLLPFPPRQTLSLLPNFPV
jgi:hypothetical protein